MAPSISRVASVTSGHVSGTVTLACDQPAVTAAHLRELAGGRPEVVASAYIQVARVFQRAFRARSSKTLLILRGDLGGRAISWEMLELTLPCGELNVDTIQDLERALKLYQA